MKKSSYILICIIALHNTAFCQEPDTSQIIRAISINDITAIPVECDMDTSLSSVRFYNPPFQDNVSVTFTGNAGHGFINNHFFDRYNTHDFLFHSSYFNYFHSPYSILHYNTRKPFTELKYLSSGTKDNSEQVITALHTQNVNQFTNIGVLYDVIASKGYYLDQDAKANRLSLFGSMEKEYYSLYLSVHTNKIINQENGGLRNVENFTEHLADDPLAYAINLEDASSTTKKYSFFASQTFRHLKDSAGNEKKILTFLPAGAGINHTFNYSRFMRTYTDLIPSSDTVDFYSNNYYLTDSANDSAFMHTLDNTIAISFMDKQKKNLIMTGIKHQYQGVSYMYPSQTTILINETERDTIVGDYISDRFNNISLTGNITLRIKKFAAFINGEYFLAGYRRNDISANIMMQKTFGRKERLLSLGGSVKISEPDYFLKKYSSSHFRWNNDFNKTFDIRGALTLSSQDGSFHLKTRAGMIHNFIYFNETALPQMNEENIYVASLSLYKAFHWRGLNNINDFLVQYSTDDEVIRIPVFACKNSIYYENSVFKNALKIQLGFDFYYNTSYYSDTFMPALGVFYQQNSMSTGNYPYLNGFLNWKVKRTRFFLNYTNALEGIAGYNYFTAYGYPMNGSSLKFGLVWTFYD